MSSSALARTLLMIGIALAVWPYLSGRLQPPVQPHRKNRVSMQLNLDWVRWEVRKVSLVQTDDC